MKIIKYIVIFALAAVSCRSDEPIANNERLSPYPLEIECVVYGQTPTSCRTYYERDADSNVYSALWSKDDKIAICFDESEEARCFNLLRGENSPAATFYGPVPDAYDRMTAVYPHEIYRGRNSKSIEVSLPSEINYESHKILSGAMPGYAQGTGGVLNFYNLMSVIKISVSGIGLLRSVSVSSKDGYGLSGDGQITIDKDGIPTLSFEKNNSRIKINVGLLFLSVTPVDLYIPIPSITYENGLKLDFEFEGKTETRELRNTLYFDRSELRAVKPYEIKVPFNFDNYQPMDNEIWYRAKEHILPSDESVNGLPLISESYSNNDKLGVYMSQSAIVKINGPIFTTPNLITYVKLPDTVQEIAMNGLKQTSIDYFESPKDLRILGTDAFLGCSNLKRIVLNDGLESIGLEVFGNCPNLEYVYIPKTVQTIGAYSFRGSTSNLDHWEGDCPLIDKDRHTLYANSAYGMVSEKLTQIDNIAACNLSEYSIPENALSAQNYAFSGCREMKKLIVHDKFISFGSDFFAALNKLETIICYAENPPSFHPNEIFKSTSLKEIKVPKQYVERYKEAVGWKEFSDIIIPL